MKTNVQTQHIDPIVQSLSVLNVDELDDLMGKIILLRRQKMPSVLSVTETDLLKRINTGAPTVVQRRYNALVKKRHAGNIAENEFQELLDLTSYMESFNVKRLGCLIELATLRNVSLDELLEDLQIKPKLNVA